jgi:predicted O-linked N-acetylglucosamine transferase (SPINDLY family)
MQLSTVIDKTLFSDVIDKDVFNNEDVVKIKKPSGVNNQMINDYKNFNKSHRYDRNRSSDMVRGRHHLNKTEVNKVHIPFYKSTYSNNSLNKFTNISRTGEDEAKINLCN